MKGNSMTNNNFQMEVTISFIGDYNMTAEILSQKKSDRYKVFFLLIPQPRFFPERWKRY